MTINISQKNIINKFGWAVDEKNMITLLKKFWYIEKDCDKLAVAKLNEKTYQITTANGEILKDLFFFKIKQKFYLVSVNL